MASLANLQSTHGLNVMIIGHSGAGKTTAIGSLAKAGYNIRIIATEQGLAPLLNTIMREKNGAEILTRIDCKYFVPDYKVSIDKIVPEKTVAGLYPKMLKALDDWTLEDGTTFGHVDTWDANTVIVLDSLTGLCESIYIYADQNSPSGNSGKRDDRNVFMEAQRILKIFLRALCYREGASHLVMTAHIDKEVEAKKEAGKDPVFTVKKEFAKSIGKALSSELAQTFDIVVLACINEQNGAKREIKTQSTPLMDLKTTLHPDAFQPHTLPMETGLATIFDKVIAMRKQAQSFVIK